MMKPFHLNLGLAFSQPYESDYAILRRCIVANPGVPYSLIETNLRKIFSKNNMSGLIDRLCSLQSTGLKKESRTVFLESVIKRRTYERQCPECSRQLYHSDLYILPWMKLCPIHHCNLVTECPECFLPWPNEKEMAKRSCNTCGLLPVKKLGKSISAIKNTDYKPIEEAWDIADIDGYGCSSIGIHDLDFNYPESWWSWWNNVPLESVKYPSIHSANLSETFSRKIIQLGIKTCSCHHKTVKIYHINNVEKRIEKIARDNFLFHRSTRFKIDAAKDLTK